MRKVRKSKTFGRKAKPNRFGVTKFEIAKLELQPGDTLVLRTDVSLSDALLKQLSKMARKVFPGTKTLILGDGLQLAVLSKQTRMRAERPPWTERRILK